MSPTAATRPRLPRAARVVLIVVAVLIALPAIVLPVLAWAFDFGGVVRKQVIALKPAWEQQIGRGIDIGTVSIRLFPTLAVAIHDVAIQAEPARAAGGGFAAEPLARLSEFELRVAMWPLLTSLGKRVDISGIEIAGPAINVVRFADGRLSYQDIVDRLGSEDKPPSQPMSPETIERLGQMHLGRAALTQAALRFHDLQAVPAASFAIDNLDLIATDVQLGEAFTVTLDAAVLAPARNLHLAVRVGPVPRDLVVTAPLSLLERLEFKLSPVEIEPLLRFVPPPTGLGLGRAQLQADLLLETPASAGKVRLRGSLGALQLVVQGPRPAGHAPGAAAPSGQPTDLSLQLDLTADPIAGDIEVPSFTAALGEMALSGKIDVRSVQKAPQIRALSIASRGLTFERILAVLPPGELPPGAQMSGPIQLAAAASGSPEQAEVTASLDLGGAALLVPKALRKPAGVALRTEFAGRFSPGVIDIKRLALVLGALSVAVHGTARPTGDFDLSLDSITAAIDPLLRLLPGVEKSIPAGTSLAGNLSIGGHVKRVAQALDGDIRLALAGATVKTSALELLGGAELAVKMRAAGASDVIDASLDLTPARVLVPGSLDKAAGVPVKVVLGVDRAGPRITVREASLEAPGADVRAAGTSDGAAHRLNLQVSRCALDLAKLSAVAPLLRDRDVLPPWLADGRIQFTAAVDGDPAHRATIHARLDGFDLAAASGHVKGFADVVGADEPSKITFDFAGTGLDFDRILGTAPASGRGTAAPAPAAKGGAVVPRFVKTLALEGKLRLDQGRIHGVSFANLVGDLHMAGGKGEFRALRLDMFGGSVAADGSTIDVNPNPPRFSLKTRLSNIEVGQLVAFESPALGKHFDGHGSVDLAIEGTGLSWAQIAPQLSGQLGLAFADGKLTTPSLGGAAVNQLLGKVPGLGAVAPLADSGVPLRNLSTRFHIADGQLRTTAPVTLDTAEGSLSLAGGIGLDQRLALTGNISVPPAVIAAASGGRIKMSSALPLSLRIGGTFTSPQVEVVDLVKTASVLAASLLAGQGTQLLQGALGQGLGGQVGGAAGKILGAGSVAGAAEEAQKQLAAAAQQRLAEEQAKVQAQIQQRLSQQVQQQLQQSAQQKIADEARKRLGGGLGGLFGN